MIYAVSKALCQGCQKDVHLRVMHIKDLCVDICPTGYLSSIKHISV